MTFSESLNSYRKPIIKLFLNQLCFHFFKFNKNLLKRNLSLEIHNITSDDKNIEEKVTV